VGVRLCSVLIALGLAFGGIAGCAASPDAGAPPRLTPPMGWNSWNSGIPLTEDIVKATVDALVSSGMRDAGYRYVNLGTPTQRRRAISPAPSRRTAS
jgi:alpha-galactosidase